MVWMRANQWIQTIKIKSKFIFSINARLRIKELIVKSNRFATINWDYIKILLKWPLFHGTSTWNKKKYFKKKDHLFPVQMNYYDFQIDVHLFSYCQCMITCQRLNETECLEKRKYYICVSTIKSNGFRIISLDKQKNRNTYLSI